MNNQVILTGTSEDLVVNVQVPAGQPLTTDLEVDGNPVDFTNPLPVGVTNQVDVTVQNFPGNLATSDLQTSGNSTLSNIHTDTSAINGKLPSLSGGRVPVEATISGSVDTEMPAASALGDAMSNPTTPMIGAALMGWTGSLWKRVGANPSNNTLAIGNAGFAALQIAAKNPGSVWTDLACDTTGRLRVMPAGSSPHADATTDVYTQTAPTAFTSGVCTVKATAGRVRHIHVIYSGATASGMFLQLHNAATATAPTDASIRWVTKIDTTNLIVDHPFVIDIPCSAGIKLAFSSTASTYTAATSETGIVIVHYA